METTSYRGMWPSRGHEDQPFGSSLGNQEPIKWIPVVHREAAGLLSVMERQRKVSEALFPQPISTDYLERLSDPLPA